MQVGGAVRPNHHAVHELMQLVLLLTVRVDLHLFAYRAETFEERLDMIRKERVQFLFRELLTLIGLAGVLSLASCQLQT